MIFKYLEKSAVRIFLVIGFFSQGFSQSYPLPDKSSDLFRNANAIVRIDSCFYEIMENQTASVYFKFAVTILNESGAHKGRFGTYYNSFISVKGLKIRIFDKHGNLKKSVGKSEIRDEPAFGSYKEVTDSRILLFDPEEVNYPYTIEYEYTRKYSNLFYLSPWWFQNDNKFSIEKSVYVLKIPDGLSFKYLTKNISDGPYTEKRDGYSLFKWEKVNLKAFNPEPYGLAEHEVLSTLLIVNERFKFGDLSGDYLSWKSFGKWDYELNKNRDLVSDETINKLRLLTNDAKSVREKVDKVYKFVQANTRYESIQLGIGGFQTFPAKYVEKYNIGDCKALSNYTMSLLKSVGVQSYCALIHGNSHHEDISPDFVSSGFNHVILCVPDVKDTIWLECTSGDNPTGYLGPFTADKHALLITPEGGKLVKTPGYTGSDNRICRRINVLLDDKYEKGFLNIVSSYYGLMADERFSMRLQKNETVKKWLEENININNSVINKVRFMAYEGPAPYITEELDIEVNTIVTKNKDLYYCYPMLYDKSPGVPIISGERINPLIIRKSYATSDTTIYTLPVNAAVETLPDIVIKVPFGYYSMSQKVVDKKLVFIRTFSFQKGTYPKEMYPDLVRFLKVVSKGDQSKAVIKVL